MPQDAAQDGRNALLQHAALHEMLRAKRHHGERIAFLRREKGWSGDDLAARLRAEGVPCGDRSKVCRWERGMKPRKRWRPAIAKVLGVEESVLFN
jgi:transcriptional regulator with XRE-family HTH domain